MNICNTQPSKILMMPMIQKLDGIKNITFFTLYQEYETDLDMDNITRKYNKVLKI